MPFEETWKCGVLNRVYVREKRPVFKLLPATFLKKISAPFLSCDHYGALTFFSYKRLYTKLCFIEEVTTTKKPTVIS